MQRERDNLQRSSRKDIFSTPALNSATGQAQLTSWRTEPEIGPARQEQLARCLATTPDITRAIYPFKGMKLSRADVEWLLAAQLKDLHMGQSDDQFSASSLEYMLTQLHAGGVVMYALHMHTFAQTRHARAKMHKHAALPLRIAADEEGGYVERGQPLFGPHPGADEAATCVIALKLASHLMPGMPSQMCNSAEKGALKKLPLKMSATCTPYFPGKQHKTPSAKREKGKIKKLPLKMSATCTLFPGSRGTVPDTFWMTEDLSRAVLLHPSGS